ncbi:MAG: endolytic transglycosylase MltG, partial [Thiothrix sp.]
MKKLFKWFGVLVLLALLASAWFGWQYYRAFLRTPLNVTADNAVFEVKGGATIRQVARQLQENRLIRHGVLFIVHARLTGTATKLKAGEYQLEAGMKPDDLLQKLVSGQVLQYSLTLVEGKTFKEFLQQIRQHPQLVQTLTDADMPTLMATLGGEAGMSPEGWFLPVTYHFPRNTTDVEFLKRSYQAMRSYLQQAWEKRAVHPNISTPYQALTLASIVEKETGLPEERPLVARVFYNRLEKGMLLQTDPSVIYGLGDNYDGNLRKSDLQTDTPYNTYTRAGLPPTPIAMPGKAAIDAVMHPADSDALYFVATTPGGASYFSTTLDEHNRAVQRFILNRNKAVR